MSDDRVSWAALRNARAAARRAQVAADVAWARPGGSYANTQHLRIERDHLEDVLGELSDRFQAQYDLTATQYEVRFFSRLPEYRPRGGVVCIIEGLTVIDACERMDDENADDHDPTGYAFVYDSTTGERVS